MSESRMWPRIFTWFVSRRFENTVIFQRNFNTDFFLMTVKCIQSARMIVGCLTTEIFSCFEFRFGFHPAGVYKELTTPSFPTIMYNPQVKWLLVLLQHCFRCTLNIKRECKVIITSVWKVMVMTYLKVFRSVYVKSSWQTMKNQSGYLVTEPKLD